MEDDVFCHALAKVLYHAPTPVTVGFYAPWGHRKNVLLQKVQDFLVAKGEEKDRQEMERGGPAPRGCRGWDLVAVLFQLLFFRPVPVSVPGSVPASQDRSAPARSNIQHIFIRFSAWEFAGSDRLWAGLVTTLCDRVEEHFGLLPVSLFRALRRERELRQAAAEVRWESRKILCLPLWAALALVAAVVASVAILALVMGIPLSPGDPSERAVALAEGLGGAVAGAAVARALPLVVTVAKNAMVTLKGQVERQMNRTDLSGQLDFMNGVKREVRVITACVRAMESFQRRRIRIVLQVSDLDKCSPDKLLGVLEALSILLSERDAPFVSILAVDPGVVAEGVETSLSRRGLSYNGYAFLNRLVTLPFSVPPMGRESRQQLLAGVVRDNQRLATETKEDDGDGIGVGVGRRRLPAPRRTSLVLVHPGSAIPRAANDEDDDQAPAEVLAHEMQPLMEAGDQGGPGTIQHIRDAHDSLLSPSMVAFMSDSVVDMRRLTNSVAISMHLLVRRVPRPQIKELRPLKLAAWVMLANQWPCHLSWLLQCLEDERQLQGVVPAAPSEPLWETFERYREEFDLMKPHLGRFLVLDGDPELFQQFLRGQFRDPPEPFHTSEADLYLPVTVNLDLSIKRRLELLRGSRTSSSRPVPAVRRLPVCAGLRLGVEEVCKKLGDLGFKGEPLRRYRARVREHNLNGRTLLLSDPQDIREALSMSLGDWALFSEHFLGGLPQGETLAGSPSGGPPLQAGRAHSCETKAKV
ncbi:NTPase KAP family P-loop domain-containing protein 1-like [Ornithorhynchus anatinus]|uniref:NTPase KAP family P-loop domain-containing protein 1-like n=1 Tax=Ornithorhynchus anatinus TaxID=9258 RepID=UPI0010A79F0E|nr:NTPase KAP family P-loop domain-containing protein 1-like [Ornithorhynchus anatinus]